MVLSRVTALVTGAASGLGQATALRFLQQVDLFAFPPAPLALFSSLPCLVHTTSNLLRHTMTTKKGARVVLADLPATKPAALASLQELDQDVRARGVFAGVDVRVGVVKV